MRIVVMGAGGTGGYFGGLLARAREDVTLIARGQHLQAIRHRGLTVKSPLAGDFNVAVQATAEPCQVGPVDLILVCVKTYDTEAAAELLRPLVGAETLVLSVQNGIENAARLAQVLGRRPVIGGVAYIFSTIEAPGVIVHSAGPGKILFGELSGGTSPRTERLLPMFRQAGIAAELRPDIHVALWEKFINICAASGLTALTRLPLGTILACPETAAFLRQAMEEVEALGRAEGIPLPAACVEHLWTFFRALEPEARSSLYHDLAAGRRLELESLHGTVVRLGHRHRLPTPCNTAIYAALKPYLNGAPRLP
jgi:2-dehydropantoate 2-reductase